MATEIDISKRLTAIKAGMPELSFPIANAQALLKQIEGRTFTGPLKGKQISASAGVKHIPAATFPIASTSEFDTKISSLISSHATKKGFEPINPIATKPIDPIGIKPIHPPVELK